MKTKGLRYWGSLALCSLAAAASLFAMCDAAHAQDADEAQLIKHGEYVARAGDCIACHSAAHGKPFAGGLPLETPLGNIISTNITPSKTNGIGNYTYAQFSEAVRHGVRADGANLYPAMPYTSYAKITDGDMKALYAFMMKGVAPVDESPEKTDLPFPFGIRMSMGVWNAMFLQKDAFKPDRTKSAEWNRGAYLVQGLAHCSTCHSPRNLMMAEDASRELGGGVVGTWHAPNITPDVNSGVGSWSEADLVAYMKTGQAEGKAQAAGPMAEAVDNSLRHLSDADLQAMAVYIKSIPAIHDAADQQSAASFGQEHDATDEVRGHAWPEDKNKLSGAQLYDGYCASCHQAKGEGANGLPSLFHNTALGHANTDNLVMVMLDGVKHTEDSPEVLMPGFADLMTDQQMATLGNYVLTNYGNPDAKVSVEQIKTLRAGGEKSPLVTLARAGMVVGVLVVLGIIVLLARRRKR
jgi:mono/diheme cytochrome c family protein